MRSLFFCVYDEIFPVTEQTAILLITEGGMGYEREAYPYGSAQGSDPGVTQAYCAYAAKHEFDTIDTIDILDCNGGDHGYAFATNFNPEINLREVSAPGSYWENGHWVEIPAMSIKDPASLGPRTKGKTNIGCIFTGTKDGKPKTYYIYNVCDHQECYREVESQAISYTTCKNNTFNGMPLPAIWVYREDGTCEELVHFGYEDFKARLGKI